MKRGRLIASCLPHLNSTCAGDNRPLPTAGPFIDLCVPCSAPPLPTPKLCGVEVSSQVFSDSELFSRLMSTAVGSCFPLSSLVKEGIGDWLSSVGSSGKLDKGSVSAMEAGEVSMAPRERGLAPERAAAQPWGGGGFYDLAQGTAFLLSSCSWSVIK